MFALLDEGAQLLCLDEFEAALAELDAQGRRKCQEELEGILLELRNEGAAPRTFAARGELAPGAQPLLTRYARRDNAA